METIADANGVPVQVTVNHESFGVGAIQERSETGVAGLIHPCYIVNPYQTWNQTYSVWSRFQGIPSGVHNRKFNGIFALLREDCDDGMFCSETWLSSRNIECPCDRREKTSFSFSFP